MRISGETTLGELYHGSRISYIDLDEDEIMHWKYIKREKLSNGKYRYYYDESELNKSSKDVQKAYEESARLAIKSVQAQNELDRANKDLNNAFESMEYGRRNGDSFEERIDKTKQYANAQANYKDKFDSLQNIKVNHDQAIAKADALQKKYNMKKIVSFPERVLSKGIVMIANLLSGFGKKKKK